ncbi:MAG: LIC12162 family protein [Paracoccaceae bacterium]
MKTLITTASKATYSGCDDVLYLGEWCKKFGEEANGADITHTTLPYHWDDEEKVLKDYKYLGDLYECLLCKLSDKLNEIHEAEFSLRYWRIILGPWLSSYIAAVWDRWENINAVFLLDEPVKTVVPDVSSITRVVANDYLSSIRIMAGSDDWNYLLYCNIFRWKCHPSVILVEKELDSLEVVSSFNGAAQSRGILYKAVKLLDRASGRLWCKKDYKCVLYKSYLSPTSLMKLSLRLGQPIRVFSEFEKEVVYSPTVSNLRKDAIWFSIEGDFERFLCQQIQIDIPKAYLEDFKNILSILRGSRFPSSAKSILTANAHYHNELFKIWAAGMVEQGSKLIISAHGGALRGRFDTFGHEEDISDFKTTWHEPVHSKHVQLSPNKPIRKDIYSGSGKSITVIGLDTYRYANRFPTGPMSSTFFVDFRQKVEFIKLVKGIGLDNISVRPYVNPWGWASRERYCEQFGPGVISETSSIDDELLNSKIVVCTYPQSTFSEAMHIGVPTLLLYVEGTWILHDHFLPLLQEMKRVGIFHSSAESAAIQIKKIHSDPLKWWNSTDTKMVRSMFDRVCGAPDKDIGVDEEWGVFLSEVAD